MAGPSQKGRMKFLGLGKIETESGGFVNWQGISRLREVARIMDTMRRAIIPGQLMG